MARTKEDADSAEQWREDFKQNLILFNESKRNIEIVIAELLKKDYMVRSLVVPDAFLGNHFPFRPMLFSAYVIDLRRGWGEGTNIIIPISDKDGIEWQRIHAYNTNTVAEAFYKIANFQSEADALMAACLEANRRHELYSRHLK